VLVAILQIVKDVRRKYVALQVLAMNLLRRNVVQDARKSPMSRNAWVLKFSSFRHEKSRAPEHVKRDPHVFDLVLFLHPKKCLTCGRENFALLLVMETVPGTFAW